MTGSFKIVIYMTIVPKWLHSSRLESNIWPFFLPITPPPNHATHYGYGISTCPSTLFISYLLLLLLLAALPLHVFCCHHCYCSIPLLLLLLLPPLWVASGYTNWHDGSDLPTLPLGDDGGSDGDDDDDDRLWRGFREKKKWREVPLYSWGGSEIRPH